MAAYELPTFNLTCGIYTNNLDFSLRAHRLDSICQLRGPQQGPRGGNAFFGDFADVMVVPLLLLPALTDIRDKASTPGHGPDLVEVPVGSGRWYCPQVVDDIGKGFANEHRFATLQKVWADFGPFTNLPSWPAPIP
jgi:hypothetical protein